MRSRTAPFDPAADADPRRRARPRDPGAVDVAPDDVSFLGRSGSPRSPQDLADYGYAGQHYPIYGQPRAAELDADDRTPSRSSPYSAHVAPESSPRWPPRGAGGGPEREYPSFLHPRRARPNGAYDDHRDGERGDDPRSRSGAEPRRQPWLADPASSAFAFGYTTSLGANAPPSSRRRGNAGKGPRDYVRADARIREDVCDRLSDDDAVDASEISVEVNAGEVALSGSVLDRYSKSRAEDIAASVRGVVDVKNQLSVHKGLLRELGDAIGGAADAGHHGHHGSGTRPSG